MLLSSLPKIIKISKIINFKKNNSFSSVTSNSKIVNNRTLFIFDSNSKSKKKYIDEAIRKNTPAIITNKTQKKLSKPQFIVSDLNYEIQVLLKKIYNKFPNKTIAVTGTNGKTSVVWYISKILTQLNHNHNTVGTLGHFKNGKKINDINLTTPAFEELYKYGFSNSRKNNSYIFEASSHAIDQNRIRNYPIQIAAITNLSKDHLDYHKNFTNYKNTKVKLFTKYLSENGIAIINSRIKNSLSLKNKLNLKKIKIIYFGKNNFNFYKTANKLKLKINNKKYLIDKIRLTTDIELENLECAIACCAALGIKENDIVKTIPNITNPPGRLQKIYYKKKNSIIIIDYAHTPDALKRTLKSLIKKKIKPKLLFGCGGDRDKTKRKDMGIIGNNFSSKTYITDDNPRNENPSYIRKNIIKYCPNAIEIPGRKKAIKKAISELEANEILLIAGKGHENLQIIKNKKLNFDDYKIVQEILKNEY